MLAAAHARNDRPLTRWVRGGVGSWRVLQRAAATAGFPACLLGLLVTGLGASALAAVELPGFLTPKKSLVTHGGTVFELRIVPREDDTGASILITKAQLQQTIAVLDKRLKAQGMRDARVAAGDDERIVVKLPGVAADAAKPVRNLLEKTGKLELREVSTRNDEASPDGKTLAARVAAKEEIVPGYRIYPYTRKDADGNETTTPILLNRRSAISGGDIALATPSPQQADAVFITLNKPGTDKMIAFTKDMARGKDRIAIVLDGIVISAPVVNFVPLGKSFIIEGLREPGEVQSLVCALSCPLEFSVVIETERSIPPPNESK